MWKWQFQMRMWIRIDITFALSRALTKRQQHNRFTWSLVIVYNHTYPLERHTNREIRQHKPHAIRFFFSRLFFSCCININNSKVTALVKATVFNRHWQWANIVQVVNVIPSKIPLLDGLNKIDAKQQNLKRNNTNKIKWKIIHFSVFSFWFFRWYFVCAFCHRFSIYFLLKIRNFCSVSYGKWSRNKI